MQVQRLLLLHHVLFVAGNENSPALNHRDALVGPHLHFFLLLLVDMTDLLLLVTLVP